MAQITKEYLTQQIEELTTKIEKCKEYIQETMEVEENTDIGSLDKEERFWRMVALTDVGFCKRFIPECEQKIKHYKELISIMDKEVAVCG